MEASKVYYTDFRCPVGTSLLDKLRRVCIAAGIKDIDMDGKFVAIKMHFGELGNLAFLRPNYAKVVADLCKEQGGLPFLTDCNTLYPGSRKNALEHLTCAQLNGFWPMTTGCQVIIADGLRGTDEAEVPVPNGEYCKTAKIGRAIMDADIFISLTHFKGHESTGFGGTLKNIGMGCGSRAGKMIQHAAGHPEVQQSLCRGCHRCAKECGSDAITYDANNKAVIDQTKCKGCGRCIGACNFDAIYSQCDSANEMLDRKMAEYAAAVCAGRPCFHVSLVQDISPNCDCHCENDAPILPDIGIFASFDPVALDQACADACLNAQPLPNSQLGQNLAKPGWNCHHDNFKDSNPNIEWKATLEQAEKIGMGTRQYVLKKVCCRRWPRPFPQKQKEADQPGQLLFMLGLLARCGHAVVQHGLQGLPVLQGAAGQGVRVKAGVLNAASHAVLVAQKAQRVRLDHRPGLGKAFLLISVQRVVPAVESFLHGFRGAGGKAGVFCPLQQGCRCDHRFERAAGNTRPPAQTRLKGGSGAGDGEDGVLVKIAGVQAGGVGPGSGIRQVFAGSSGACRTAGRAWRFGTAGG